MLSVQGPWLLRAGAFLVPNNLPAVTALYWTITGFLRPLFSLVLLKGVRNPSRVFSISCLSTPTFEAVKRSVFISFGVSHDFPNLRSPAILRSFFERLTAAPLWNVSHLSMLYLSIPCPFGHRCAPSFPIRSLRLRFFAEDECWNRQRRSAKFTRSSQRSNVPSLSGCTTWKFLFSAFPSFGNCLPASPVSSSAARGS